jgi:hypothetical protein
MWTARKERGHASWFTFHASPDRAYLFSLKSAGMAVSAAVTAV